MNAARDLAATGTPGPWAVVDNMGEPWDTPICAGNGDYLGCSPDDGVRAGFDDADAAKIVRAVNALGPLGDLLDATRTHRKRARLNACVVCDFPWPCPTSFARDAVEAALRGEGS